MDEQKLTGREMLERILDQGRRGEVDTELRPILEADAKQAKREAFLSRCKINLADLRGHPVVPDFLIAASGLCATYASSPADIPILTVGLAALTMGECSVGLLGSAIKNYKRPDCLSFAL